MAGNLKQIDNKSFAQTTSNYKTDVVALAYQYLSNAQKRVGSIHADSQAEVDKLKKRLDDTVAKQNISVNIEGGGKIIQVTDNATGNQAEYENKEMDHPQ